MTVAITALAVAKFLLLAGVLVGAVMGVGAFILLYGFSGKLGPSIGMAVVAFAVNWFSLGLYIAAALIILGSKL